MAEILQFAKGSTARKRAPREAAGEIVIFPGVRVEYHQAPRPPAKRKRRRARRAGAKDALSA